MPRPPDSSTDTYLDVLRTLGVTDAALRRHHGAGSETPLRVAIDGDRGSPTADLLDALAATGRLLDCRDGLAPDDDRLTAAFARFGLRIECAEVDGDTDADADAGAAADTDADAADLELHVTDDVTGETTSHAADADDPESAIAALREVLPDADAIAFAELLDGRHLVADARELDALAERYGPRVQPFDDPLLVPDDAIEVETGEQSAESATPTEVAPSAGAGAPAQSDSAPSAPSDATEAPTPASDDEESFGEFVSAVDDSAAEAVQEALADGEPETHTIEGDGEDVAAATTATIGGGPSRTVSTSGIDDVFDQLESSAPDDDGAASTTIQTMSESSDPPTDEHASTDDTTPNGLTGGPTRTVSSKSADDILEQATGDSDFDAIAAEEGDADPDAVLADAEDVPPALEDADVAAELSAAETASVETDSADDEVADGTEVPAPDADEPTTAQESAAAADVPPADPAATANDATEEAIAAPPADDDDVTAAAAIDPESETADDATPDVERDTDEAAEAEDPTADDPATPMPSADDPDEDEQPSTLDDDLLEDDVELRRGSEAVDRPAAPDAGGIDVDPDESADADGPLAAAGGVSPPDAQTGTSEPEAGEPSTPAEEPMASADEDAAAPDASAAEPGDVDESVETDDAGLVGRITSTIFGR